MISSMTAFARESASTAQGVLTVELRSVNHRYLDCSFKLPDNLRQLEPRLRDLARAAIARGKLDCLVRLQAGSGPAAGIEVDQERLAQLLAASELIAGQLEQCRPLSTLEVLAFPGICVVPESSDDALLASGETLFHRALQSLQENRHREGDKLQAMVTERLGAVAQIVAEIRGQVPELVKAQRERLLARIGELAIEIDSNRLEQELVHMAHKADVDEELDRLGAHVEEVRRTLEQGGPCGRRLDFLMQELNREANTLSSKSIAGSTTHGAVELKVLIEQMREQIQNIE
jgi:uncharacterized protein (TIGR00255 family)